MATTEINLIAAAQADFLIYEGDTTAAVLSFSDTDTGVPVSFVGKELTMEIRNMDDNTIEQTFSTTSDDINISGAGNNVVTITGWEAIPYNVLGYKYDLQSEGGGQTITYLVGLIKVTEEVTEA